MEKTPIKIPGKRIRDTSREAVLARKALNRPPGRPLKLTSAKNTAPILPSTKLDKPPKKRSMKNLKSRNKMSHLEKLPTELLEDVFSYALNISLPKSSPVIGGKLSNKMIYSRAVNAAFSPTWDLGYGLTRSYNETAAGRIPGDSKLQSAILACRWATLPFLLKIQDEWIQKNAPSRLPASVQPDPDTVLPTIPPNRSRLAHFDDDFEAFSTLVQSKDFDRIIESSSGETYLGLADGAEIPHGLLLGPWTEESTKYLFWLVKSGAKLEWVKSINGEVALLGMKNAITVGDLRVIHLLLWVGLAEKIDLELVIHAISNAGGDKFAVLETLLHFLKGLTHKEANNFWRATDKFRIRAELQGNEDDIAFINKLETSETVFQHQRR